MYNEVTAKVNSTIEICNGKIYFDAIDPISEAIGCKITTPWNTGSYVGFYEGSECSLYKEMEGIPPNQTIKYAYLIKVPNIDFINNKATFKVLSYADENNYDLKITETTLPTKVKPGDTINFKYNIKNQSNNNVTVRFILGASSVHYPERIVSDDDDCDYVIPPTTILDVYKHCWYDDWILLPQKCNEKTLSPGLSYDISGSFTTPSINNIYIRLITFVYKENYWSANKNEWTWSNSHSASKIEVDKCLNVTCKDVCVGNNLYTQVCDPNTGNCVQGSLKELNSPICSPLEPTPPSYELYYKVPKIYPLWYINKVFQPIADSIDNAVTKIIPINEYYIESVTFNPDTYILTVSLKSTQILTADGKTHTLIAPIVAIVLVALISLILAPIVIWLFGTTPAGQKELNPDVTPSDRTITFEFKNCSLCNTNSEICNDVTEDDAKKIIYNYISGGITYENQKLTNPGSRKLSLLLPYNESLTITFRFEDASKTFIPTSFDIKRGTDATPVTKTVKLCEPLIGYVPDKATVTTQCKDIDYAIYDSRSKAGPPLYSGHTSNCKKVSIDPAPLKYECDIELCTPGEGDCKLIAGVMYERIYSSKYEKEGEITCPLIWRSTFTPKGGENEKQEDSITSCEEQKNTLQVNLLYVKEDKTGEPKKPDFIKLNQVSKAFEYDDTTGYATITGIEKGTYTINVTKTGYTIPSKDINGYQNQDQVRNYTLDCNQHNSVTIESHTSTNHYDISIMVTRCGITDVVKGATVKIGLIENDTDENGYAYFDNISEDTHTVTVTHDAYTKKVANIVVNASKKYPICLDLLSQPIGKIDKVSHVIERASIIGGDDEIVITVKFTNNGTVDSKYFVTINDSNDKEVEREPDIFYISLKPSEQDTITLSSDMALPNWSLQSLGNNYTVKLYTSDGKLAAKETIKFTNEELNPCCISLPSIGCIASKETCKTLKLVGIGLGAIIVGYTIYKILPQRKLISSMTKNK